jgi:hypothetical protein
MDKLREEIAKAYEDAVRLYEENGKGTYEAGRVDGIKTTLEIVDRLLP